MIALVVEAATYVGSAALVRGTELLVERTVAMRGHEREALMPAVAELFDEAGLTPRDLSRVICGAGPGAFTSLRIAGGIAKGICVAASVPLVPVSSLALLVAGGETPAPGRYLAVLDAMRGEHYAQLWVVEADGGIRAGGARRLVPSDSLVAAAENEGATLVGPGVVGGLARDPHARGALRLASLIAATTPADLAAWEPVYGRLAEAQVKWESQHGRPLASA